jgi:hypothetical protein
MGSNATLNKYQRSTRLRLRQLGKVLEYYVGSGTLLTRLTGFSECEAVTCCSASYFRVGGE